MFFRDVISIGNLFLDVGNYRIVKQSTQKETRNAIISEQGKKLLVLAKDIIQYGLNPFDLPLVVPAQDGNQNYIVIEGNRRLTAIKLMLEPDLAEGTILHSGFKRLNKNHEDAIPKMLDCVIAPSKQSGLVWVSRKHDKGLEGAGTEPWSAIAKERADAEQGKATPNLDVLNFVLTNPSLDSKVRDVLLGSKFNITTLARLIDDPDVRNTIGINIREGKVTSEYEQSRVLELLTDVVSIIATKRHNGKKFTERLIDNDDARSNFIQEIASKHPKKKKSTQAWSVCGKPTNIPVPIKIKPKGTQQTLSTEDRTTLIPKSFKIQLPTGKINDVFVELRTLDVTRYRHAVSVLFRVFIEFSLNDYIERSCIPVKKDKLINKLVAVVDHVKSTSLMNVKELKPINVAISAQDSILSPETLNAFVHSSWMNPDPLSLKLAWNNAQLFLERLWLAQNNSGQK